MSDNDMQELFEGLIGVLREKDLGHVIRLEYNGTIKERLAQLIRDIESIETGVSDIVSMESEVVGFFGTDIHFDNGYIISKNKVAEKKLQIEQFKAALNKVKVAAGISDDVS